MKRHIIIALLLLFAVPASAEVILTEQTEYYPVTGRGKNEILKNMKIRSPYKMGGEYVPAYTETDLKYEYRWSKKNGRCVVSDVKIHLTLTYVYPRLGQLQDSNTKWWWRETINKFKIHEGIHGDISKRSAYDLDRELRSLDNLNCENAKQTIATRAQYLVRQLKKKQEDYDRITDHGRKQNRYSGP